MTRDYIRLVSRINPLPNYTTQNNVSAWLWAYFYFLFLFLFIKFKRIQVLDCQLIFYVNTILLIICSMIPCPRVHCLENARENCCILAYPSSNINIWHLRGFVVDFTQITSCRPIWGLSIWFWCQINQKMNNVVYMLCNDLYVGRMNGALVCDNSLLPLETVEKSYEFI